MARILIAEKDPAVQAMISARLVSRKHQVVELNQSEDVLRYLDRERVDLILLSTDMERIGGRMLVERLRECHHLKTLPVIMLARENEISELILSHERGFDDFLIKPFNSLVLQLRVAINISRTQVHVEANALTQLPGNISIEKEIRAKIKNDEKFSMLYIDINHFKSFNDRYGFEKGDDVIRQVAKIMSQTRQKACPEAPCFIGHIGGDDFVVILNPDDEELYAREFIDQFDRLVPTYYQEQDRKHGYIRVRNRRGKTETFPLMSCSVAAATNLHRPYQSLGEISRDIAEVKSFLKSQPGSHYLRDRRSSPIAKLEQAVEILNQEPPKKKEGVLDDPLGKILINAGLINEDQLSRAMKRHMATGQRLGQTLISMNLVRSEDVGRMLEKKMNIPYVSLKHYLPSPEVLRFFTKSFMKSHRVVPLEIGKTDLKIAMCDPFDLKTLDQIESTSGRKPIPYLALEDEFEEFVQTHYEDGEKKRKAG